MFFTYEAIKFLDKKILNCLLFKPKAVNIAL